MKESKIVAVPPPMACVIQRHKSNKVVDPLGSESFDSGFKGSTADSLNDQAHAPSFGNSTLRSHIPLYTTPYPHFAPASSLSPVLSALSQNLLRGEPYQPRISTGYCDLPCWPAERQKSVEHMKTDLAFLRSPTATRQTWIVTKCFIGKEAWPVLPGPLILYLPYVQTQRSPQSLCIIPKDPQVSFSVPPIVTDETTKPSWTHPPACACCLPDTSGALECFVEADYRMLIPKRLQERRKTPCLSSRTVFHNGTSIPAADFFDSPSLDAMLNSVICCESVNPGLQPRCCNANAKLMCEDADFASRASSVIG